MLRVLGLAFFWCRFQQPLIINNIQLSGYTTVYSSMYLLKDFLVALAIMNKAAINISVQVFEWT